MTIADLKIPVRWRPSGGARAAARRSRLAATSDKECGREVDGEISSDSIPQSNRGENARDLDCRKTRPLGGVPRSPEARRRPASRPWPRPSRKVAALPDPVGGSPRNGSDRTASRSRISVPIGVIGIIFESRPNVTADAGAPHVKAGNAADPARRLGQPSFTARHPAGLLREGLDRAGLPIDAIQLVPTTDRGGRLLLGGLDGAIDVMVPRGGKSLVARVQAEARVPVLAHLEGICHVYVDAGADLAMARATSPSTPRCGAPASAARPRPVLIDRTAAPLISAGGRSPDRCRLRGAGRRGRASCRAGRQAGSGERLRQGIPRCHHRAQGGGRARWRHRAYPGPMGRSTPMRSLPRTAATAERFLRRGRQCHRAAQCLDTVADGGEFGFGAEIGIATGWLHARGPVGLEQLTTFKYQIRGAEHLRPWSRSAVLPPCLPI